MGGRSLSLGETREGRRAGVQLKEERKEKEAWHQAPGNMATGVALGGCPEFSPEDTAQGTLRRMEVGQVVPLCRYPSRRLRAQVVQEIYPFGPHDQDLGRGEEREENITVDSPKEEVFFFKVKKPRWYF